MFVSFLQGFSKVVSSPDSACTRAFFSWECVRSVRAHSSHIPTCTRRRRVKTDTQRLLGSSLFSPTNLVDRHLMCYPSSKGNSVIERKRNRQCQKKSSRMCLFHYVYDFAHQQSKRNRKMSILPPFFLLIPQQCLTTLTTPSLYLYPWERNQHSSRNRSRN